MHLQLAFLTFVDNYFWIDIYKCIFNFLFLKSEDTFHHRNASSHHVFHYCRYFLVTNVSVFSFLNLLKILFCYSILLFKNAIGILAARCTSCNSWHILLCISANLPEAISNGRLNPATDIILLLTTCRGGSHLTSDII